MMPLRDARAIRRAAPAPADAAAMLLMSCFVRLDAAAIYFGDAFTMPRLRDADELQLSLRD